jgi:hypothetical protein
MIRLSIFRSFYTPVLEYKYPRKIDFCIHLLISLFISQKKMSNFEIHYSGKITGRFFNVDKIQDEQPEKEEVVQKEEEPVQKEEPNPKELEAKKNEELLNFVNYLVALLPHYPKTRPAATDIAVEISKKADMTVDELYSLIFSFMPDPSKVNEEYRDILKLPTQEKHNLYEKNMEFLSKKEEITPMKVFPYDLHDMLTLIAGTATFLGHSLESSRPVPLASPPPTDLPSPILPVNPKEEKKSKLLEKILGLKKKLPPVEPVGIMKEEDMETSDDESN